jgi:hypothetical protein
VPDVGVPLQNLNSDVRVWVPEGLNTFTINEPIGLAIEVVGPDEVIFPRDYGNRMFTYSAGKWVEVENVPTDWGEGSFLVSPSNGEAMEWAATEVFPWFDEMQRSILLRVFVTGNRYRGSVNKRKSRGVR